MVYYTSLLTDKKIESVTFVAYEIYCLKGGHVGMQTPNLCYALKFVKMSKITIVNKSNANMRIKQV